MSIHSVTMDGIGPFAGRNRIDFSEGRTVIFGRNATGKTTLFNALRERLLAPIEVDSYTGWRWGAVTHASSSDGPWRAWRRYSVEVSDGSTSPPEFVFVDVDGPAGPLPDGTMLRGLEHDEREVLARLFGGYIRRLIPRDNHLWRTFTPEGSDRGDDDTFTLYTGLRELRENGSLPSSDRFCVVFALALAMRHVLAPWASLVLDDCCGMLDDPRRERLVRVLIGLYGQVILFTSVDDVAERLGIDYVLAPVRHARGIRARRYVSSRQRPVV